MNADLEQFASSMEAFKEYHGPEREDHGSNEIEHNDEGEAAEVPCIGENDENEAGSQKLLATSLEGAEESYQNDGAARETSLEGSCRINSETVEERIEEEKELKENDEGENGSRTDSSSRAVYSHSFREKEAETLHDAAEKQQKRSARRKQKNLVLTDEAIRLRVRRQRAKAKQIKRARKNCSKNSTKKVDAADF